MNFALLGDHPDGVDMARALIAADRHRLIAYYRHEIGGATGPPLETNARRASDVEDVLADPAVEMVIVATGTAQRGATLRRALQSERHVLCVHPADGKPDLAFEAAMIRADTKHVLLPLLPEAFHPGVVRFAEILRSRGDNLPPSPPVLRGRGEGGERVEIPGDAKRLGEGPLPPSPQPSPPGVPGGEGAAVANLRQGDPLR